MSKPSRFRAQPVVLDGVRFDSRREAFHWQALKVQERHGLIRDLARQVAYPLIVNDVKVGRVTWDFQFVDVETGEFLIVDVKSPPTRKETAYRLRKRLWQACYPALTVTEVE